jgi:hypothetical protein
VDRHQMDTGRANRTTENRGRSLMCGVEAWRAIATETLWAVMPDGIYFAPEAAPRKVAYFDFATARVRDILEIDKDSRDGLPGSPDGRPILFSPDRR